MRVHRGSTQFVGGVVEGLHNLSTDRIPYFLTTNTMNSTIIPSTQRPVSCTTMSDRDIVLRCFQKAIEDLEKMPEGEEKHAARKQLLCGYVKRSKIEGVNSIASVIKFIGDLGEAAMIVQRPGTNCPLLRFEVPVPYKAYSPIVRLKDLELWKRGRVYAMGINPCVIRTKTPRGVVWEHVWHAPHHPPIRVEAVTFILNETWDKLTQWFAGELPALWPADGDPGTQWIYLGVDKVDEHIHGSRKPRYDKPKSVTNNAVSAMG